MNNSARGLARSASFLGRLGAVLLIATSVGCASSAYKRAQAADEMHDYDVAVANYAKVVREQPNRRDAELALDRAKLRASEAHFNAGRRLASQGRHNDALAEFQLAVELNPTNEDARRELRQQQLALRTELAIADGQPTLLESVIAKTRDLAPAGYEIPNVRLPGQIATGQQSTTRTVYLLLARLANLSITFDSQFRDAPAPVSLLGGMTVRQALDAVARSTGTFYQITGPATIVVVPDTPNKRREYTDEVVRQFTVQNLDLKEAMEALRIVADARYTAAITGTNTILVRDTPERVQMIGRFLGAFDKAKPELIVDVEVLEVDRTRLREYGLQLASPGSPGIDGVADANRDGLTLQTLRTLSQSDVLMGNIPALYYRLLKTDSRTRTLANPHIRMTDGTATTANFGQSVPVPRVTITPLAQGGANIQPQTQFDYRNIGVNLGITPRTHPNDDVTLNLTIELSSLGAPGFDGLPTFGTRLVSTTIRLKDGETNILAGLIREDERTERQTIPGLGDVPILGNIFSRNRREAEQTDVVVMLTPHIVRVLSLSEEDLRPLRVPREGTGSGIADTPIVPPPPTLAPPATALPPPVAPAPAPGGIPPQSPTPSGPGTLLPQVPGRGN